MTDVIQLPVRYTNDANLAPSKVASQRSTLPALKYGHRIILFRGNSSVRLPFLHAKQLFHELVRNEPNAVLGCHFERVCSPALEKALHTLLHEYLVKRIQLAFVSLARHLHAPADNI